MGMKMVKKVDIDNYDKSKDDDDGNDDEVKVEEKDENEDLDVSNGKKLTANAVNEDPAGRERWIPRKEI